MIVSYGTPLFELPFFGVKVKVKLASGVVIPSAIFNTLLMDTCAFVSPLDIAVASEFSSANVGTPLKTDKAVTAAMLAVTNFFKNVFFMIIPFIFKFLFS